ncbi:MAG: SixA phosphatase family protein [Gaiellaceae bacterium]
MTAIYLVRHAKAKKRAKWTAPDHLRPLTKPGLAQAAALPAHYGPEPFARLFTSPYVRCVQTLEPLSEATGLPLETADALAEGEPAGETLALMLSLAAEGPAVCCTHADVLFDVIEALAAAGVRLDGSFEFEVAGTWILEVEDRTFTSGRYLQKPDTGNRG